VSKPQQFPIARQSAGKPPARRPGSIRRTTTIDTRWPDGLAKPRVMIGRGRDLITPLNGQPSVVAEGGFDMLCSPGRDILELQTTPPHPNSNAMVGVRAGGASRTKLAESLGDLRGTVLFQLLDDFAGASLVAPWVWSNWTPDWPPTEGNKGPARAQMENICTGFTAGSSSFDEDGHVNMVIQSSAPVEDLNDPADPFSWHDLMEPGGPEMRRARRLDVWREGGVLKADAGFQDSGTTPSGGRRAVHEYRVHAEVDEQSGLLTQIKAIPLILPFAECPGAVLQLHRLVGQPVVELRSAVAVTLPGILGCTHLNDVVRSLADVPTLARALV